MLLQVLERRIVKCVGLTPGTRAPLQVVGEGVYFYDIEARDSRALVEPDLPAVLHQSHKIESIPIHVQYNMTDAELQCLGGRIMNVRCILRMSTCISVIVVLAANTGWAGPPDGLVTFVEGAAADLASSPLGIPQFKSAKVDGIEDLGKANGSDRYLCWLKNDQSRVGYIAIVCQGGVFQVLAFSATITASNHFLRRLDTPRLSKESLRFSRVTQMTCISTTAL